MRENDETAEVRSVPQPDQFEMVGGWFRYMRSEGFAVAVQVPHAISRVMEAFDIDHQAAFEWLIERGLLLVRDRLVLVDMRALHVDPTAVPESGFDSSE